MLSISNEVKGDVNEVKLVGRLDAKAARDAEDELSSGSTAVKLCAALAICGITLLLICTAMVRKNGGTIKLRGVQEDVMEVFEMTGFAAMLEFE